MDVWNGFSEDRRVRHDRLIGRVRGACSAWAGGRAAAEAAAGPGSTTARSADGWPVSCLVSDRSPRGADGAAAFMRRKSQRRPGAALRPRGVHRLAVQEPTRGRCAKQRRPGPAAMGSGLSPGGTDRQRSAMAVPLQPFSLRPREAAWKQLRRQAPLPMREAVSKRPPEPSPPPADWRALAGQATLAALPRAAVQSLRRPVTAQQTAER
jgi:hypothetical protein